MVASLLTVLSSGIQDERLAFRTTLYPFVRVWVKTGRFTTQWVRLDFDNVPAFGQTGFVRLTRKGHLITRLFLVAEMPDIWSVQKRAEVAKGAGGGVGSAYPRFGWTNSLGHALVGQLTLDIGGSRVESLDGQLMEVLDEFYTPMEKVGIANQGLRRRDSGFTDQTWGWPPTEQVGQVGAGTGTGTGYKERVVVPLPFWFSRGDMGCALPIDAIGADEVRCSVTFRSVGGLYFTSTQRQGLASEAEGSSLWPMEGSSFYSADPVADPSVLSTPLTDSLGVIQMPTGLTLGECYVMAEYVYLDQNEANRFRLSDLQVPVVQHYAMAPYDTRGLLNARIPLRVPNPCRAVMFFCQPWEAGAYNAHFLATRDMTGTVNTFPDGSSYPWWPDAVGASGAGGAKGLTLTMRPAFALSDSEPVSGYALEFQGGMVRYRTEGGALFRSVIPSYEMRKAPWVNRYYYYLPFGIQNGWTPFSQPRGEANLDKMTKKELVLQFRPRYGTTSGLEVGRFQVRVFAETYNVLRVFGGRAGLLFAY